MTYIFIRDKAAIFKVPHPYLVGWDVSLSSLLYRINPFATFITFHS